MTTPYESTLLADLAEAERTDNLTQRIVLGLMIDSYRRGVLDERTKAAPLLETLKVVLVDLSRWVDASQWDDEDDVAMIRGNETITAYEEATHGN